MKWHALLLTILCAVPAVASAQQGPPPPDGGPPGPMQADRQKMMQMREAFRSSVLQALTPEHRALLAKVVGDLAVADNPDPKAAAEQLDSALSSGEKDAILKAASDMQAQMKSQMDAMRSQWQSAHPDASPPAGRPMNAQRTPDPGRILLMVAGGGGGPMMMGPRGGGPPRQP
jgi:hypothetical protein